MKIIIVNFQTYNILIIEDTNVVEVKWSDFGTTLAYDDSPRQTPAATLACGAW